ncbi:dipeptide epimerase [soil metagenome]
MNHFMQLQITAIAYQLKFKHAFGLSHSSRNFTDTLYVKAEFNGLTGYGEAALPPYLGYDVNDLVAHFEEWFPERVQGVDGITETLAILKRNANTLPTPVRTAVDIALMDLYGHLTGKSVRSLLGLPLTSDTLCTYTLGVSSTEELIEKLKEAKDFRLFKLKLGDANYRERVLAFKANSPYPFCADANQGWKSTKESLTEIVWLKEQGCIFIEQPLPVTMKAELKEVHSKSVLPVILDESIQNLQDLEMMADACAGINVKLVKCGGMEPAMELIRRARKLNKKVLVGCMSESSCGAAAAAQLSGWADWVDLDGPALIENDPFEGVSYEDGRIVLAGNVGTGAIKK